MIKGFKMYCSKQDKKTKKVETIFLGLERNFNTVKECYTEAWRILDTISNGQDNGGVDDLMWVYMAGDLLFSKGIERMRRKNTFLHESEEYYYKAEIECY